MEPIAGRLGWRILSTAENIHIWAEPEFKQIKKFEIMKHLNKIILIAVVTVSCFACKKSFLDRPSQSQISSDNFYKTTSDLRLATANLYGGSPWGIWHHEAFLPLGDILSGNGN